MRVSTSKVRGSAEPGPTLDEAGGHCNGLQNPEGPLQVALVRDQHPVQTLGSRGPDEPFRDAVRLGCTNWGTKNPQTVAAEDVVER